MSDDGMKHMASAHGMLEPTHERLGYEACGDNKRHIESHATAARVYGTWHELTARWTTHMSGEDMRHVAGADGTLDHTHEH